MLQGCTTSWTSLFLTPTVVIAGGTIKSDITVEIGVLRSTLLQAESLRG